MNEFEELRCVHRIQKLLLERYKERTDEQIRRTAANIAKFNKLAVKDAYEAWESQLLSTNPNPEL